MHKILTFVIFSFSLSLFAQEAKPQKGFLKMLKARETSMNERLQSIRSAISCVNGAGEDKKKYNECRETYKKTQDEFRKEMEIQRKERAKKREERKKNKEKNQG